MKRTLILSLVLLASACGKSTTTSDSGTGSDMAAAEIHGVKLGMSADEVRSAAKAAGMSIEEDNVDGAPHEKALVLRDKTASPNQVGAPGMVALMANGGVAADARSGLKLMVLLSAADYRVMEIEARNAGVDPNEGAGSGVLYELAVKKWGKPTLDQNTGGRTPVWGDPKHAHLEYRQTSYGNELLDDAGDTDGRFDLFLLDPVAVDKGYGASHPASAPPKL